HVLIRLVDRHAGARRLAFDVPGCACCCRPLVERAESQVVVPFLAPFRLVALRLLEELAGADNERLFAGVSHWFPRAEPPTVACAWRGRMRTGSACRGRRCIRRRSADCAAAARRAASARGGR